jgi:hypothetical protein
MAGNREIVAKRELEILERVGVWDDGAVPVAGERHENHTEVRRSTATNVHSGEKQRAKPRPAPWKLARTAGMRALLPSSRGLWRPKQCPCSAHRA